MLISRNALVSLPKNGVISYRFWNEECAIYHQPSAQTHLIEEPGCSLFKAIAEQPLFNFHLLTHLTELFEFSSDVEAEGLINTLLLEYQALGLVEIKEEYSL